MLSPTEYYRLGITGNIAAGKSVFAEFMRSKGVPVIDADREAHLLYERRPELSQKIAETFGVPLKEDGTPDRAQLSGIVFQDSTQLQKLSDMVHPILHGDILRMMREAAQKEGVPFLQDESSGRKIPIVTLEAALLWESGWAKDLNAIVLIDADPEHRHERLVKQRGLNEEDAKRRIQRQIATDQVIQGQSKVDLADWVLYNESTPEKFAEICEEWWDGFVG